MITIDLNNLKIVCVVVIIVLSFSYFIMLEQRKETFSIYKKRIRQIQDSPIL